MAKENMQTLLELLQDTLKKDNRFISAEGDVLVSEVMEKALSGDTKLTELLLSEPKLKSTLFIKVKDVLLFDVNNFNEYIQNKNFLNNSYTKYKNKIGLNIDGKFLKERGEVSLVFPFKDCVLEGGQTTEEQKRKEIFFNQILARDEINRLFDEKVLTNFEVWDGKSAKNNKPQKLETFSRNEKGIITDNLLIKGNNLLALHTISKEFSGRVKLIYIDPPYNTQTNANTFNYNNTFNHSTWMTFMKNRLEIAKDLLKQDGIICVAIDQYELFYLGIIMDEIFGRENRISVVTVVHNPGGRQDDKFFPTATEFMLFYAKNIEFAKINKLEKSTSKLSEYKNKDKYGYFKLRGFRRSGNNSLREQGQGLYYSIYFNEKTGDISLETKKGYIEILPIDDNGVERCWRWGKDTFLNKKDKYIVIKKVRNKFDIYVKERESDYEGEKAKTIWDKPEYSGQSGTGELKKIFGEKVFSYPKSPYIIKDVLTITTKPDDIVLDFFCGSGTTCAVAGKMRRQYIGIEQMDYADNITKERLKKIVSQNEFFIYFELEKLNQKFIDDIKKAKDTETLLAIWERMKSESFIAYNVSIAEMEKNIEDFKKLSIKQQKQILCEMLDKNQLYLNLSEINDNEFKVSESDKKLNKDFYKN